ncbi:hypothetical protein QWY14_13185 [Planococcus sp. N028]|uniref:Uncharacterized protein n=1 Tax=Planococcus shixiaomingii TaxID=3058393 RepID=A0ABT8N4F1_9BACL|nr:hypothetical protein [Planococcus sp. N028]MDN7242761.1 hypothetical protein [Planococcus sp. N028]
MDEGITKLLMKKVKKHRKWAEDVFVNPIYWEVNGKPYFMAGFMKNNIATATAYLTIGEETKEEVMLAQFPLALFANLSSSIFQIGEARMKVGSAFYINPLNIAVSTDNPKVLTGREAFAQLWDIQQKFNRLIKDFKHYYNYDVLVRKRITEEDIIKTQETANQVNMYQYLTVSTLLVRNDEIRAFANFLETTEGGKELDAEQLIFVKTITENKEALRYSLAMLDMIVDEDIEKMKELNYHYSLKKNKKIIEKQRQFIRFPKR